MPWMHIYIDNDAFGADTYEELMDRLGKVLERAQDNKFIYNWKDLRIGYQELELYDPTHGRYTLYNLAQDTLCQRHKLDVYPFTTSGHLFTDDELVGIAAGDDDERRIVAVIGHRRNEDEKGKLEFIV